MKTKTSKARRPGSKSARVAAKPARAASKPRRAASKPFGKLRAGTRRSSAALSRSKGTPSAATIAAQPPEETFADLGKRFEAAVAVA